VSPSASRFSSPDTYTPKHLAEKILTSRAALEGERKQVTVLFADLKGSMELLADRDPEEARSSWPASGRPRSGLTPRTSRTARWGGPSGPWYGTGMVKVTFTLDDETVGCLRDTARRLEQAQSAVVRAAIRDYSSRVGRPSERERRRLLRVLDDVIARLPDRMPARVRAELAEIRASRRHGGRRHSVAEP